MSKVLPILISGAEALPRIPTLTPKQTELLFAIWEESRFKPRVHITHAVLAEKLKDDEGEVRRTIAQVKKVSDKYLLQSAIFTSKPGKRTAKGQNAYLLNDAWIVTYPDTAAILQELNTYVPVADFRIDRAAFEADVAKRLNLTKKFVQERLDKAIAVEYIKVDGEYIYPSWRMTCEADFLSRLSKFYTLQARAKRRATKGI